MKLPNIGLMTFLLILMIPFSFILGWFCNDTWNSILEMYNSFDEPISAEVSDQSDSNGVLENSMEGLSHSGLVKEVIKNVRITAYTKYDAGVNCISVSQKNICWTEENICACPSKYEFGTKFIINGKEWICLDRMAPNYREGNNFDLWYDDDLDSAIQFGIKYMDVEVLK